MQRFGTEEVTNCLKLVLKVARKKVNIPHQLLWRRALFAASVTTSGQKATGWPRKWKENATNSKREQRHFVWNKDAFKLSQEVLQVATKDGVYRSQCDAKEDFFSNFETGRDSSHCGVSNTLEHQRYSGCTSAFSWFRRLQWFRSPFYVSPYTLASNSLECVSGTAFFQPHTSYGEDGLGGVIHWEF